MPGSVDRGGSMTGRRPNVMGQLSGRLKGCLQTAKKRHPAFGTAKGPYP